MSTFLELDPFFAKRDISRKSGQPVEIARTKRLLIRETVLRDVPELYQIWQHPSVKAYVQPMQPTLEEEIDFMEAYIRYAYSFYDFGLWSVLELESEDVIGRIGLSVSEHLEDAVELGYMIAPKCQRKGYAIESGEAVLKYASQVLDLPEIHLLSDAENVASLKTARALGFVECEEKYIQYRKVIHMIWKENR